MKNEIEIHIRVPNQTYYLSLIGRLGEALAHQLKDFSGNRDTLANSINVVLTEAITNAIKHANRDDPEKHVDIRISVADKDLVIKVFDQGHGFDLNTIGALEFGDKDLLDTRGRGIYIIRSLMDSVAYSKTENGNVLEMRKHLDIQ